MNEEQKNTRQDDQNTEQNTDPHLDEATNEALHGVEDAIGALFTVGRLWASHGLRAAELALETSAQTLRVTAEALGDASTRIGATETDAETDEG